MICHGLLNSVGRRRNLFLWGMFVLVLLVAITSLAHLGYGDAGLESAKSFLSTISTPKSSQSSSPVASESIPKTLVYKLGPKGRGGEKDFSQTCIDQNPDHTPTFYTDDTSDDFVIRHFSDHPEIVKTYLSLTVPILKADLFRYLALYAEGGVYSDLDVQCKIPIYEWIPSDLSPGLIVGWEVDVAYDKPPDGERQFCTWTIAARPGVPHLFAAVTDIIAKLHAVAEQHNLTSTAQITMEHVNVVDTTGPRQLTRSVLASLERTRGRKVEGEEIYHLLQPKMVEDVLILPGWQFAAGNNPGYTEEEHMMLPPELVAHHWAGSWKNPIGGESLDR